MKISKCTPSLPVTLFSKFVSNILMFKFVILVTKLITMNSVNFEHFPDREYPAIELDMTNFVQHLSDENICGKAEVRNDDIRTSPKIFDCEIEECTDLAEISAIPVLKLQQKKVSKFDRISCVLFSEEMYVVDIINVDNHSLNYILNILSKLSCKMSTNNFTLK